MIKTVNVLVAVSLAIPLLAWADPNWLVTPDEVRQETVWTSTHKPPPRARSLAVSSGPEINLLSPPSLLAPLKAPFPIRLSFKARDGAAVKPESFRALYGFLKVDITDRLVGRAKVGPDGIEVDKADIPAGNHRLILRVSDDRDRQTETEIRFAVE